MTAWPLDNTEYTAEAIGAWSGTRTRGVFSAEDCFSVTATGGFGITVSPGLAWLLAAKWWGIAALEQSDTAFTIDVGSGLLPRYVAVVLQYNKTSNEVQLVLRYGEYGSPAVKPQPVRDDYYDEIILASILQPAAAVEITKDNITDERLNEDMCGIMRDGVTGIPTAELYAQWEAFFEQTQKDTAEKQQENEDAFFVWFQHMKDQLSEDAAGNLQKQIDDIKGASIVISVPADGWQGDNPPYTNTVEVFGMTADIILNDIQLLPELVGNSDAEAANAQWSYLNTLDGAVEFVAEEQKPTADFTILAYTGEKIKTEINLDKPVQIVAGDGIEIEQQDGALTISATGVGKGNEVYSTEETKIGTWIDGKPLYRRCFITTSPSEHGSPSKEVVHIEIPVSIMVHIYGSVQTKSKQMCPVPYYISESDYVYIAYNPPSHTTYPNSLRVNCGYNTTSTTLIIVLEYTKTTD